MVHFTKKYSYLIKTIYNSTKTWRIVGYVFNRKVKAPRLRYSLRLLFFLGLQKSVHSDTGKLLRVRKLRQCSKCFKLTWPELSCESQQWLICTEFDKELILANVSSDFKVAMEMFNKQSYHEKQQQQIRFLNWPKKKKESTKTVRKLHIYSFVRYIYQ